MDAWSRGLATCLALYGLFVLLSAVWRRARERPEVVRKVPAVSLLLLVKNKERVIEGLIRHILSAVYWGSANRPECEIVVIDEASSDATPEILERLARKYGLLRLVRMDRMCSAGKSAADVGLFLCRSKYTLVCNLEGAVDVGSFRDTVASLLGEQTLPAVYQEAG